MSKKVLVVSYYFYPNPSVGSKRPTELARTLVSHGWEVDILSQRDRLTAAPSEKNTPFGNISWVYQHPGIIDPLWNAISKCFKRARPASRKVEGIKQPDAQPEYVLRETGFLGRSKRLIFSMQALLDSSKSWVILSIIYLLFLKLKGKEYDLIISSSPIGTSHFVANFARKLFKCNWIIDLRDPLNMWDEVLDSCKMDFRVEIENRLEHIYYENCDAAVVTAPTFKRRLEKRTEFKNKDVSLIYNGFDGEIVEGLTNNNETPLCVYAGTLYMGRDPFPLFSAIAELNKSRKRLALEMYGDCSQWKGIDLKKWVHQHGYQDYISFGGNLPPKDLDQKLKKANILVNFAQNQKLQIPAKTFEYLKYTGVLLNISEDDSDSSLLVRSSSLGIVCENREDLILEKLERILAIDCIDRKALASRKNEFSRINQNEIYLELIGSLTQ